ncbi:MAG: DUF11 domain-containing protein [Spirosoma sp.]|uniref:SdrD B-like domain-containing protein n=1 Tax=Spirosoma sp. TaxID=1899569 RepID=UPI001ACA3928|nr:SdrD B-like domain-containing protein [Spirosoma sp.]MBN8826022.1 DUF11 domain-containing protein [Spirosoma sp.]
MSDTCTPRISKFTHYNQPPLSPYKTSRQTGAKVWFWIVSMALLVVSNSLSAQVSGTVFRDFIGNGVKDTGEPGVGGITVTAYYNNTSTSVVSTTAGSYSFAAATIPSGTPVRLEFSGFPTGNYSGPFSPATAGNGTSVQFVTAGNTATNINFAVNLPNDYCQDNPKLVTACYVNGDANTTTPVDALVSWNYNDSGTTTTNEKTLSTKAQIGSGWGIAYSRTRKLVYTAAFLKRHVAVGPGGLGAIYVSNPNSTTTGASVFITIPNAGTIASNSTRGLGAPSAINADPTAFPLVGAIGLGDLDISDDEQYLYVTNLNDKKVYVVDISSQTVVTSVSVPDPGCSGGTYHPFALAYRAGKVYVGVTCDASTSNSRADLMAYVYVMDAATNAFSTTPVLQTNLNYRRTSAWNESYYANNGQTDMVEHSRYWYPWVNTYTSSAFSAVHVVGNTTQDRISHPTPLFSDIEFDLDGSMILGFIDRTSHQIGSSNYQPTGNSSNNLQETNISGGDILRAAPSGNTWTIESLNYTTTGTPLEFYSGELYASSHYETAQGGLALVKGKGEVVTIAMDPLAVNTGGTIKLSNTTGLQTSNFQVFNGDVPFFAKATGLGDIQALCNIAPIEIGNRVWNDANRNGIQDPNEAGISGVTVTLYKSNTLIATATTNTDGEYYFSSDLTGTNSAAAIYSLTALTPGSTVQLRIAQTQSALTGFSLSPSDVGTNNTIDSDFTPSAVGSTTAVTDVTLGVNGQNVHTFDAGVYTCPTITFTSPAANTQYCGNGTATFTVSTNAVAADGIKLVAFTTETDPYSTTAGAVFSTSVVSSTATGTKTLTFSNVPLPDNLTGANMGLFVYAILVSADGTCRPVDDLIITLKPRPNTVIGGSAQVCTGDKATLSADAFNGATYQWFYGSGTAVVGTTNPYTTTAINTATTYRVRLTLNSCVSNDASFTVTPVTCTSCVASATSLGGKVYRDFDSDGIADTYDGSLSNVTVTLFRCDATNQSTQVATMQTDLNGAYSFTGLTAATTYRVEFSNLPAGYQPTFRGTNNGTMVQFTQPGSCTTNLGINLASDYCQTNPLLVTPCYLDGAVTPNNGGNDVLVGVNYDLTGSVAHLGTRTQIGSTWGVAYAKTAKKLYSAAFLKRHVGLKDGNLGQIYITDMTNPTSASTTTTAWLNVSALVGGNWQFATDAARGLANAGTPSLDAQSFSVIAGIGLGDIDISEDEKTLYVMDLTNKQLLSIDIATKILNGKYPVPELCSTASSTSYFSAGAGNETFTAADGKQWQKGYLFDINGNSTNYGQTITNTNSATAGTSDAALYANSAYVATGSTMTYSFPVGNGTFGVKLHFATNATTSNRNTTVALESTTVLSGFDVYAAAGNQINVGVTRSFTTTVTDGVLNVAITCNSGSSFAMVSGFELTTLNNTPTGVTRPFALAVHNGKVYVGAVCDASHSQSRDDLTASVLVFDPVTNTYEATPLLTVPLNYTKGANWSACPTLSQWHPWTNVYPNATGSGINCAGFTLYTQPTLSDIEFDVDGTMILGFFDRFQHQQGAYPSNYTPDGRQLEALGAVGGDLLRAYFNGTSYELEYNGKEGSTSPKPATSGQNSGEGIGGGEFYVDNTSGHQEISAGGLALKAGSGEVRVSTGDPLVYNSGGLTGFDNKTGAKQNGFTLYAGVTGGTQNKANGLGDLEVLCDLAPIQIGNRVWRDDNRNGIQDPCEPAIPGVVVTLYDAAKTTPLASVTTNAAGEYYFSSTTVTAGTSTSSVATTALTYNSDYALVITSLGTSTVVTGLSLTNVSPLTPGESSTANSGTTQVNNDAMVMNGKPTIMLTTGGYGANNHTYDFGIAVPDCAKPEIAISNPQTICQGSSFSLPLSTTVTSNTVTGVQWYYTDANGSSFTAISGATSLTFSPTTAQQPTSTGGIRYYALIGQNGLSASCSDTAFVNLRIKPTQTLTISTPSAATVTQCSATALALSVSTNAVTPDQIQFVYFTSPQSGTAMYTGGTVLATINSTTATGSKTLSYTVTVPTNTGTDPLTYYVYAILQSTDDACKPSDSFVLKVSPAAVAVIGGTALVCQGTSTTLTLPPGGSYKWSTGATTRQITPAISATTTTAVYSATLTTVDGCVSNPATFTVTGVVCTSCVSSTGRVGGIVYNDFDANGVKTTTEPGLSGITVTIYRCDNTGSSTLVNTTTTDITGNYFFSGLTDGVTYRVEFGNVPTQFQQSARGSQSGTSVQFVTSPSCGVSLGLSNPTNYCESNPSVAVVCFARNTDGSTEPTIITIKDNDAVNFVGRSATDNTGDWSAPTGTLPIASETMIGNVGTVGTTLGLAWDKTHKQVLTGAYMRAYAPMKTAANGFGEGVIYKIGYSSGTAVTPTTWLDLETVLSPGVSGTFVADATFPDPSSNFGVTNVSPARIGYTGLGSLKMASDNSELYVVNLNKQEVIVIPVDDTGAPVSANLKRFPLPTDGCPTGNWSDGRPYMAVLGLGVHPETKRVYATVTCTGPTINDLKGLVYSVDPSDATPSASDFQLEATLPLNLSIPATNPNVSYWYSQTVHPWEVVTANTVFYSNSSANAQHTQPWLGEIAFDLQSDGKYGMTVSTRNRYHDLINSTWYVTGGILQRLTNTGTNASPSWTLESNAVAGDQVSTVNWTLTNTNYAGGNTSTNNRFFKYVGREGTMLAGMIDYVPGRQELVLPAMDNVYYSGNSGITWINRNTGERSRDIHLIGSSTYDASGYYATNFPKANNWGGLAVLCNLAPIQIGNRVWRDDNKNGLQDPCEPAIPGAVITLYDAAKTTALASVTTNAAGEYYFSSTTITAGTSTSSVATTALTYNTSYAVVITSLGSSTAVSGLSLTDVSITPGESGATNSGTTTINNDAMVMNGKPTIMLTTGDPGTINHTYDFGLAVVPCSLSLVATPGSCNPATNQYTVTGTVNLTAAPASSLTITDGLVSTVVSVSAGQTSATYSLTGLTSGTGLHTVTLLSSATACGTASATYTAPASCTVAPPALTVSVSNPICNSLTNAYTATGTVSLSNVVAGSTLTITDNGATLASLTLTSGQPSASFSLSGTSNAASHTVVASLSGGPSATTTYTAPVACTVCSTRITTASLPNGQVGTPYSQTLTATGGTAPYTYSVVGSLPASLTLSASGVISGTPTSSGTASFTIKVSDTHACSDAQPLTITLTALPVCSLTATATPGICSTATNTYAVTGSISSTNAVANSASPQTLTVSVGGVSTLVSLTGDGPVSYTLAGLISDGATHTVSVLSSATACGVTSVTYTAPASCTVAPACILSVTASGANCNPATNQYVLSGTITVTNSPVSQTLTLTDGSYVRSLTVAAGTGTIGFSYTALQSDGATHTVTVTSSASACGSVSTTYTAPASCTVALAGLGDFVWLDLDKDGTQGGIEPGIKDVFVTLYLNGSISATTLTDDSGFYSFTGLTPGTSNSYVVGFTTPSGFTTTTPYSGTDRTKDSNADLITGKTESVTLAPSEFNRTLDAGYIGPESPANIAGLGNFVWLDSDKDGIQGIGEPGIKDVNVTLYLNGAVSATMVTNASGFYSFTGLTPGSSNSYTVGFTTPTGYTATTPYSGNDRTKDSNVSPNTGKTEAVTLTAGEYNPTLDAGYYLLPPSLTLNKVVDKSKASQGDILTYTLVLTNVGSTTATNVTVRDSTTLGLSYIANSASAPTGTTFAYGNPVSTWTVPSLTPGQSLSLTFQAKADSTGILYNVATIPGDTAKVCTTIPVKVCQGSDYLFELRVATGHTSYQWYRDGVEIVGATTNVLSVTAAGTYSLLVDGAVSGQCPEFSCCPFIVEEDTLPTFKAVSVPVTCIGNVAQANGKIVLSQFRTGYTYQYSPGSSFNAAASLSGVAKPIPSDGVIVANLANPATVQLYTVRVYNGSGCYSDLTVALLPTTCGCPASVCVPFVIRQTKGPIRGSH